MSSFKNDPNFLLPTSALNQANNADNNNDDNNESDESLDSD